MIVTLTQLKAQLNQTLDVDDVIITNKIGAAQNHIERLIGCKIEETYGAEDQDPIPEALREAVLQLAAWWYEQRETALVGVSSQIIPYGIEEIIREFREFSFA